MAPHDDGAPDPGESEGQVRPSGPPHTEATHPFQPPALADSDAPRGVAKLVTLEGGSIGVTYELPRLRAQIGRLDYNDVVLPSKSVSKHHALVIEEDGLYLIEDLGSTNGVIVNGVRLPLDSRRRLYHGDNVRIADHLFVFWQESDYADLVREISSIQLDQERIAQEAQDLIREIFGAEDDGASGAAPSTAPE